MRVTWTNKEVAVLARIYSTASRAEIEAELPRHKWHTIRSKANKLGVFRRWRLLFTRLRHLKIAHGYFAGKEAS